MRAFCFGKWSRGNGTGLRYTANILENDGIGYIHSKEKEVEMHMRIDFAWYVQSSVDALAIPGFSSKATHFLRNHSPVQI